MNQRTLFALAGIVTGLFLSGCTTGQRYNVTVNATTAPTAKPAYSYTLLTPAAGAAGMDSRHAEVADRVRTALSQRGLYEAPSSNMADIVVDFSYGEQAAHAKVTTTNTPVILPPDPMGTMGAGGAPYPTAGNPYPMGGGGYPAGRSQVVMTQSTTVTRTSEKYLRITARENTGAKGRTGGGAQEVWSVSATIDDESDDVYKCIPALVDALVEYIGYDSGGEVSFTVTLDS